MTRLREYVTNSFTNSPRSGDKPLNLVTLPFAEDTDCTRVVVSEGFFTAVEGAGFLVDGFSYFER